MRLIATVVLALVGAVVLAATSLASAAEEGSAADRLFGGGRFHFDFDPGPGELVLPRDIGVYATGFDGSNGSGTRYYGHPNRAQPAPAHVLSCLAVEGDRAVIGAITPDGAIGVQYFDDNGPPGPDDADGITPIFGMTEAEVEQYMPRGFPRVCPSVTPPADWGAVWSTLDSGDIAVVEGRAGGDD
jgi:hypothetical protein